MSYPVIEVEPRQVKGSNKLRALRSQGKTPAILYGHNDKHTPQTIQLDELPLRRQLDQGRKFFSVKLESGEGVNAFVTEVQVDELTDEIVHVDFQRLESGDTVSLKIPLTIKGTPEGAKVGGRLEVFLHEIRIEGAIESLIEEFILDVSPLDVGQRATLASLDLPEGVRFLGSPTTTVCIVHPPKGARGPQKEDEESEDKDKKDKK